MSLGGLQLQEKEVHLIFLVDTSGSMASNAKIQSLNTALEEVLPALRAQASQLVGIEAHVRVATFSNGPRWVQDAPALLEDFWWEQVPAEPQSLTELGVALDFLRRSFDAQAHAMPPAIVLLTDGMPTDTMSPTFAEGLERLDAHPVGRSATRAAIAIGTDADLSSLEAFVAGSGGVVLTAQDPHQLTDVLRTASSSVLRAASELAS